MIMKAIGKNTFSAKELLKKCGLGWSTYNTDKKIWWCDENCFHIRTANKLFNELQKLGVTIEKFPDEIKVSVEQIKEEIERKIYLIKRNIKNNPSVSGRYHVSTNSDRRARLDVYNDLLAYIKTGEL